MDYWVQLSPITITMLDSDEYQPPDSLEEREDAEESLGDKTPQKKSDDLGDVQMASPPPMGSSRATGGILRGRALGNELKLPDAFDMLVDSPVAAKGVVRLFSDISHRPSEHQPTLTLKMDAKPSLGPILQKLGRSYSPIRNQNYRVYVYEEGSWSIKGRFGDAVDDDEEVSWVTENDQLTLSLCAEAKEFLPVPSHVPTIAASAIPDSKAVGKAGNVSKNELIALLNIPEHLTQPFKNPGLRVNYARYKACLMAQETLNQKIRGGTWPADTKKPTMTQIIELFVSKTYWHKYMNPGFNDIAHYPIVKEWLEDMEGGPDESEVWGTVQTSYSFADLQREKERRQQQTKGKGKGKAVIKGTTDKSGGVSKGTTEKSGDSKGRSRSKRIIK